MKRGLLIGCALLFGALPAAAQQMPPASVHEFGLRRGPYAAGFRFVELRDATRAFEADPVLGLQPRPIAAFVWYPAEAATGAPKMRYGGYVHLNTLRTGFHAMTDRRRAVAERALLAEYAQHGLTEAALARELAVETWAVREAPAASGPFPVVVYGPGLGDPAYGNSVLAEYLATHGYIFVAIPNLGWNHTRMKPDTASMANYARDLESALSFAATLDDANPNRLAVMGYSWGGMANLMVQMRNPAVRAVVSLDGSIAYHYTGKLRPSGFARPERMDVPFLMLQQRPPDWNADTIAKYGLDDRFVFWDELRYGDAWLVRFSALVHNDFSSKWLRLGPRPVWEQRPNEQPVRNRGYEAIVLYTHRFLDAHLRDDTASLAFLGRSPEQNGFPAGMATVTRKRPAAPAPTLAAFANVAAARGLHAADSIARELRSADPQWMLEETDLIDWGWILLAEGRCREAAGVLRMATLLHPESAPVLDVLAETHLLLGERDRAIATWRRSHELLPERRFAALRIAALEVRGPAEVDAGVCARR